MRGEFLRVEVLKKETPSCILAVRPLSHASAKSRVTVKGSSVGFANLPGDLFADERKNIGVHLQNMFGVPQHFGGPRGNQSFLPVKSAPRGELP